MASRRTRFTTLLAVAAAALAVLPVVSSRAEPRPTLEQVQHQIDALNDKIELANEDYAGSRLDLAAASRRSAIAQARVRAAEAQLTAAQRAIVAFAAAAYRSGGTDQFVQLVTTSSPQTFLDRAASLDRVAAGQGAQLALAATARHRLEQVHVLAGAEQAKQAKIAQRMASQQQTIERALAGQQRLFSSLKADEQRRLLAIRQAALQRAAAAAAQARAAAAAQRAAAERAAPLGAAALAAAPPTHRARVLRTEPAASYDGPASGRAGVAVEEAYSQLGKPYQWGAAGPDRFDCSGLTMWVWGKAGVSLPHQSRAQYAGGRKVAQADLQPGDLTFYGSPIHHVGIYIGDGRMISAPKTGDVVKIQNALRSDYVGAVRP